MHFMQCRYPLWVGGLRWWRCFQVSLRRWLTCPVGNITVKPPAKNAAILTAKVSISAFWKREVDSNYLKQLWAVWFSTSLSILSYAPAAPMLNPYFAATLRLFLKRWRIKRYSLCFLKSELKYDFVIEEHFILRTCFILKTMGGFYGNWGI